MADARSAWNETGDKLTDLGRKLKVHYDSQHDAEDQQTRQELTDAARRLGGAVQDAFEAIGTAARDKAVQEDVKRVGQSLAEALGATLGQAADEVKRAFSERKGPAATTAPPASEGVEVAEPGVPTTPAPATPAAPTPPSTPATPAGEGPSDGEQPPKVEPWGTP